MRLAQLIGGASLLVAAALVGGTLIGGALAAPTGGGDTSTGSGRGAPLLGVGGEYCDVFLETFAAELGVSVDDLLSASKAAAVAAVDAAVTRGDLDEDRAAAMRERIEAVDEAGCGLGWAFGRGLAVGHARGLLHVDVLDAAAEALGLENADLIERLGDGTSLEEVADEQGVSYEEVKSAVVSAVQADLDAAVEEGLDQERADAALERVQTWLAEGGELRLGGMRGGPWGRGGPWH